MPFDLTLNLIISIFELLKTAFLLTMPVFLYVFFGTIVNRKVSEKFKLSWLKSTLISTYLMVLLLIFVLYIWPFTSALLESEVGVRPPEMQPTFKEQLAFVLLALFKILGATLIFTLLLLPLELMGSLVAEKLAERFKWHKLVNWFIAVFITVLVALIVILLNPWILTGLIYFLYFYGA